MVGYWVVITLSHSKISLHYNRADGEARFVPFPDNEWPAPLAVYVSNDSITLGKDALPLVDEQAPGAYTDIFSIVQRPKTFSYCGEELSINKLLLCVVEQQLRAFFAKSLFGEFGDLDRNRAELPLFFSFEADISGEEKTYVLSLFRNAGYCKATALDHYRYIMDYARRAQSCSYTVVAESDGTSLCLSAYGRLSRRPLLRKLYDGLGTDPRVARAADSLWDGICLENPFLDKSVEFPRLQQVVTDFLASGRSEKEDFVRLSDGMEYDYFLSRHSIANMRITADTEFGRTVDDFMRQAGVAKEDTGLVMKGNLVGNDYFRNRLSPHFVTTVELDEDAVSRINTNIVSALRSGKEKGEEFVAVQPKNTVTRVETVTPHHDESVSHGMGANASDVEKIKKDVLTFLRKGVVDEGKRIFDDFRANLSPEDIKEHAAGLSRIRDLIKRYSSDKTADPMKGHLLFREKRAYIKSAIRNGDSAKAMSLLSALESELHEMNFHEYDKDIAEFKREIQNIGQSDNTAVKPVVQPKLKSSGNPAQDALIAGDYEKARSLFAESGDSKMERNAVSLMRYSKIFEAWEKEYPAVSSAANKRRAKVAVDDLATYRSLLRRCGLDISEVSSLIDRFKTV